MPFVFHLCPPTLRFWLLELSTSRVLGRDCSMRGLNTQQQRGFMVQEVIVGLVVFGIALLPLIRALVLMPRVGSLLVEQSRRESWRSLTDQSVLAGIDPASSAISRAMVAHSQSENDPTSVFGKSLRYAERSRSSVLQAQGSAEIRAITQSFEGTVEARIVPLGFQIGSGTSAPPRVDPLPPLPPTYMPPPLLSPSSGPLIQLGLLTPRAPGGRGRACGHPARRWSWVAMCRSTPSAPPTASTPQPRTRPRSW